ncbi:MAG: methyltransferase domain-containing protein [Bacteroidota bacterium]
MRLVQHKKEAYWFYRFLSMFYDKLVNPLFWTPQMREHSLDLAQLDDPTLTVADVGSGTGFTTEGIVDRVPAKQVTCLDQSPHQMSHAKAKEALQDCTFLLGDAENLPFETNEFDRYVSAGSIEYWPNPQKGINESYRIIKPGGVALMIGPLEPQNFWGRFFANTWMLFPKEQEYHDWYKNAGFTDIKFHYIRPHWFRRKSEYGIAIAGKKPLNGPDESPMPAPVQEVEEPEMTIGRRLQLIWRVIVGSTAGFVFIPAALIGYIIASIKGKADVEVEPLNGYQIGVLSFIGLALVGVVSWIIF